MQIKLEEVKIESAIEYTGPLQELREELKIRLEVIDILKKLKIKNAQIQQEANIIGTRETLRVS